MDTLKFWQPHQAVLDPLKRSQTTRKHERTKISKDIAIQTKVQLIANGNLNQPLFHPNGSQFFKLYNFNFWQYIDQYVHWDNLIPPSDLIEAAHTNSVFIYGTLFFNWSDSFRDQLRLLEWLQEDEVGSGTFFFARQLVDMAHYYGFDGYFINQETTGPLLQGKGNLMRQFILYAKDYSEKHGRTIRFAWYDAMANDGLRHHYDEVNAFNDDFIKPSAEGTLPADDFFINFNWNREKNTQTAQHMTTMGRNPFDAYTGFELQQNSYNTTINYDALLDSEGLPILSIGLFAADSILGLATDGADFQKQEERFWVSGSNHWKPLNQLTSLKINISGKTFSSAFNTGHGQDWYVNGLPQHIGEWNQRGMQSILPSWRWQVTGMNRGYQVGFNFEDAFNGGSSIELSGKATSERVQWYLFACELDLVENTMLNLVLKASTNVELALIMYSNGEDIYLPLELEVSDQWQAVSLVLNTYAGAKIDALHLEIRPLNNESFFVRLGEITIADSDIAPAAVNEIKWLQQNFVDGRHAEGVIQVCHPQPEEVAYYEVYQAKADGWQLVNASRNQAIRLPRLTRDLEQSGYHQRIAVVAVGYNSQRSLAFENILEWPLLVDQMTDAVIPETNLMPQAFVVACSHEEQAERAQNCLNGTMAGVSDKWVSLAPDPNYLIIGFEQAQTVQRMVFDHAGVGGESVDDGRMNTKDFDVYYTNDLDDGWQLALEVRGNRQHQTDHLLEEAVTAKYWRLDILSSHNGSPWGGVRLYNWKMFSSDVQGIENLALSQVKRLNNYLLFMGLPKGITIQLYKDLTDAKPLLIHPTDGAPFALIPFKDKNVYYEIVDVNGSVSNRVKVTESLNDFDIELVPPKYPVMPFEDGALIVRFNDLSLGELQLPLNHPSVEIHTLKTNHASIYWLGRLVDERFTIFETDAVEKIDVKRDPRRHYYVGETFDAMDGSLDVGFGEVALTRPDVTVEGFATTESGEHEMTVHFMGKQLAITYWVYDHKMTVNKEKLEQKISEIHAFLLRIDAENDVVTELRQAVERTHNQISNAQFSQQEIDGFWLRLNDLLEKVKDKD
ncbi:endo-beta-N-acetylglucosaminidase [Fundicoccus culcitae]|uniref:Discoidin domain-containing protein n=1 Tax=Fundicoccus culcitae TaxID=2969821 RepID=A0ABY5P8F7_9LACT|nr:discoidin domain-containing protein [Fundicoccus culcitae]UUX35034.1 discoidin domain-containing protein [Fundicoccus culcitae]